MTTAISYSFVKKNDGKVFGIQIAILDWLRAYLRYSKQESFPFIVRHRQSGEEVEQVAAQLGIDRARLRFLDARYPKENLSPINSVFRIDPMPGDLLWQRTLVDGKGFSFCGLAHAIAGLEGGEILERFCLAPSEVGDALVCPSRAIRSAIQSFWDSYADYLARRFNTSFKCPVQLPIIPLGVDIERIKKATTPEKRAAQRESLGLKEMDVAILWIGRLSHAIKAHPLAMFRAVNDAAKSSKNKVHFLVLGYFEPPEFESQWRKMAKDFCPNAEVTFVANNDPRFPDGLWAGSDIFLSLVDNMQESFGLTPIEAIAAGLPRVISDWDGYRDSVTHGVDGFLVNTLQPAPGYGRDLSELLLNNRELYGGFLAKTALSVAVDSAHAAQSLALLIDNPALRQKIGEAAKQRLPYYDWANIIPSYENLWTELTAQRQKNITAHDRRPWPSTPPQMPDPFMMYGSFPTKALEETDKLYIIASTDEVRLLCSYTMNTYGLDIMISPTQIPAIINWISDQKTASVREIAEAFPSIAPPTLRRSLAWMIKLGILRLL